MGAGRGRWFRGAVPAGLAVAVGVTTALVAGVVTPSYAEQSPVTVTVGTSEMDLTFNDPVAHGGSDTAQLDKLITLINGVPAGGSIQMAIYSIGANIVYDAIAAAVNRGVHVQVVHDGQDQNSTDSTPRDLAALLGTNHHWCDHGSSTLAYGGGCLSTASSGIMHAKYMLFSQTADAAGVLQPWVVWFGSANETYASGANLFNNTVTVYGDQTLYQNFYNDEWLPQWNESSYSNNDFYDSSLPRGYFGSANSHIQVYATPEQQTDQLVNRLNYIDPDTTCRIRVMEAEFHDSRIAVADKLVSLHKAGCKVWVDVGSIESKSLGELKAAGISVHQSPVHDKSVIISARYSGSTADRTIILTGSQNLSLAALRSNDELLIKIEDSQPLYDAYYNHFNDAYNTGAAL